MHRNNTITLNISGCHTNSGEEANKRLMSSHFNYGAYDQTGGDETLPNQANDCLTAKRNDEQTRPNRNYKNFRNTSIFPEYSDINCTSDPLLQSNIVNGKYFSVERYLEIHFRLNREDFMRPFRDGIRGYRKAINYGKDVSNLKNVRIYTDVHILGSEFHDYKYDVQFDSTKLTHISWNISKRLINGSLVSLTANNFKTFCFATVCGERDIDMLSKGKVCVEIIPDSIDIEFMDLLCDSSKSLIMAESVVFFEYYRHTLLTLQHFTARTFPLKEYLIDVCTNVKTVPYLTNNSSVYNLTFDASPAETVLFHETNELNSVDSRKTFNLVKNNSNKSPLESINILKDNEWPHHDLLDLDQSQYEAFKVALTKQIAIIQGPPGTGKTYVGLRIAQTLLQNKHIWNYNKFNNKVTPIVIVAKTNHALDQFLEGLVPFCRSGDHRLVRIGCQSKSEILKKYDLDRNNYSNSESLYAKRGLTDTQTQLLSYQAIIDKLNKQLMTESEIKLLEDTKYRDIVAQLNKYNDNICLAIIKWLNPSLMIEFEPEYTPMISGNDKCIDNDDVNDDIDDMIDSHIVEDVECNLTSNSKDINNLSSLFNNLRIVGKHKNEVQTMIEGELKSKDVMSEKEAKFVPDIMLLESKDRWRLYRLWVRICIEKVQQKLNETDRKFRKEMLEFNKVKKDLISNCNIIGFTTTGAAKYRKIIDEIDPLIVIIEEAAEVLESHVITALTENTCHLILIGDHQQLRPNPVVYELAVRKNLDVSMFERLIRNGLPYCQLKVQHRMCPLISSLLVPHFYDELVDHESVEKYEPFIRGVCKHVYFINHNQPESSVQDSTSKMNRFEAEFIARLCKYLVQQEYSQSQITILTMYSAQCYYLRNILKQSKPSLSKVRVAVVDNFQGEENEIILLSFVRSNNFGDIGFLKTSNRVNVSLSRAKKGMYCIGNFDCLSQKHEFISKFKWINLKEDLTAKDIIGSSLEIYCQNHTERKFSVRNACDFDKAIEGGCDKQCTQILKCAHKCPLLCHPYDTPHERVVCTVPCPHFACDLKHKCEQLCHFGKICGKCYKSVLKVIPKCGHRVSMACCYDPSKFHCPEPCTKLRSCSHQCYYSCGYICDLFPCKVRVVRLLACGHSEELTCSDDVSTAYCSNACQKTLVCGHTCGDNCGDKCDDKSCRVIVTVSLKCGHPLVRKCLDKDKKAFCKFLCNRLLECGHHCRKNCGHRCDAKYCNIFMTKKFNCGHEVKVRCNPKAIYCPICHLKPTSNSQNSKQRLPFMPFKKHW